MVFWPNVFGSHRGFGDPGAAAKMFIFAVVMLVGGWSLVLAGWGCWRARKGDWRRAGMLALFGFGLVGLAVLSIWLMFD